MTPFYCLAYVSFSFLLDFNRRHPGWEGASLLLSTWLPLTILEEGSGMEQKVASVLLGSGKSPDSLLGLFLLYARVVRKDVWLLMLGGGGSPGPPGIPHCLDLYMGGGEGSLQASPIPLRNWSVSSK